MLLPFRLGLYRAIFLVPVEGTYRHVGATDHLPAATLDNFSACGAESPDTQICIDRSTSTMQVHYTDFIYRFWQSNVLFSTGRLREANNGRKLPTCGDAIRNSPDPLRDELSPREWIMHG